MQILIEMQAGQNMPINIVLELWTINNFFQTFI